MCERDGSPLEQVEQVLAGRYVLKSVIGSGNMGTVYRATQLPMGRDVAVKLMHSDLVRNPDLVERFEREAQAAATVDHPNAITVFDSGRTSDGQVYISMELLEGESLSAMIDRELQIPPERALELWIPVVKAMVVAHRKGVIHRDLKPDNIFVARRLSDDGTVEEVVKVLDFGIAKLLQGGRRASQTVVGARIGTAMYMSPEQLEGREASPRSDVYALGLVLIEILTGRLPWGKTGTETDQAATMLRLINPPKRLREMCAGRTFSLELQKLLDDILAFDPALRPADAGELIRRLGLVPEAASLAQRSSRRTEGSQLFEAAYLKAKLPSEEPADTPLTGTELPPSGPRKIRSHQDLATPYLASSPTVVTGARPADLLDKETPPDGRDLAGVPTVVTISRPDMPLLSGAHRANHPPLDAETPPAGRDLPSVPTVVTPAASRGSLATTLPTAMSFVGSKQEPTTQPMPLARMPSSTENNTLRRIVFRDPAFVLALLHHHRARVVLGCVGVLLLCVILWLMVRPSEPQTKPMFVRSVPLPTDRRPIDIKSTPSVKPPVVIPTDYPLTVAFSRKRHPRVQIQCGPNMCQSTCQLAPGEVCVARSVGFKTRQYSYDELKPLAQAGHVEVEVRLNR